MGKNGDVRSISLFSKLGKLFIPLICCMPDFPGINRPIIHLNPFRADIVEPAQALRTYPLTTTPASVISLGYWCPLIDTSICCDVADAGTQFAISP